jgi:hypothetical protein
MLRWRKPVVFKGSGNAAGARKGKSNAQVIFQQFLRLGCGKDESAVNAAIWLF